MLTQSRTHNREIEPYRERNSARGRKSGWSGGARVPPEKETRQGERAWQPGEEIVEPGMALRWDEAALHTEEQVEKLAKALLEMGLSRQATANAGLAAMLTEDEGARGEMEEERAAGSTRVRMMERWELEWVMATVEDAKEIEAVVFVGCGELSENKDDDHESWVHARG